MTYPLVAFSVGLASIPLLFVVWRVAKAGSDPPLLFFLGLVLIKGASALIGPEGMTGLSSTFWTGAAKN